VTNGPAIPHFPGILAATGAPASSSGHMRILVTGASGFAGSELVPRLLADGHEVRALGREQARVRDALARGPQTEADTRAEVLRGDALSGEGLARALEGVRVAYYLIHSMERPRASSPGPFAERERIAAHNFAGAATRAGVERIVYLGGLTGAAGAPASRHLASREEVEGILFEAVPGSVALRASIVIGARSRSFRFLVRLVERLPVLTLPAWRNFRTQPVDGRDVIEMLAAASTAKVAGRSLDVGGPDVLSYAQIMARIADVMLINRPALGFGVSATPLTARLAAAITGEDPELVLPLMEGLQGDLLAADDHAGELLGVELHSFEAAVEHALGELEKFERLAAR
jgi:uncharacterized protein YbjT (DUF2867 family)